MNGRTSHLSSNNPFRARTVSPPVPCPTSPFLDPSPPKTASSRPGARNPFLDPSNDTIPSNRELLLVLDDSAPRPAGKFHSGPSVDDIFVSHDRHLVQVSLDTWCIPGVLYTSAKPCLSSHSLLPVLGQPQLRSFLFYTLPPSWGLVIVVYFLTFILAPALLYFLLPFDCRPLFILHKFFLQLSLAKFRD